MQCFYILNPIKRVEHWMKVREAALHADANDQQNIEVLSKKHEGSAFIFFIRSSILSCRQRIMIFLELKQ